MEQQLHAEKMTFLKRLKKRRKNIFLMLFFSIITFCVLTITYGFFKLIEKPVETEINTTDTTNTTVTLVDLSYTGIQNVLVNANFSPQSVYAERFLKENKIVVFFYNRATQFWEVHTITEEKDMFVIVFEQGYSHLNCETEFSLFTDHNITRYPYTCDNQQTIKDLDNATNQERQNI